MENLFSCQCPIDDQGEKNCIKVYNDNTIISFQGCEECIGNLSEVLNSK